MVDLVRKRLRIDGFDYSQGEYVFFATLCARHKTNPFADVRLAEHVVDALNWSREHERWRVYCFCLMPDHLHLAISPGRPGANLSWTIQAFKRWTTRTAWGCGIHGQLWQRSWYDHVARREEDLVAICEYILCNPVRRGLVEKPGDWRWSGMLDALPF